jgi:hypothetical protein
MAVLAAGRLTAEIRDGALGAVRLDGVEVLRALTYPVRNADWGTHLTVTTGEETGEEAGATTYTRRFADAGGAFHGLFRVAVSETSVGAEVTLTFARAARVNRAGFTLLHPVRGVAGTPLAIRHPDGRVTRTAFPARISPGQPARDIAGMTHAVGGVTVDIAMEGDTFEMEDQRNWSDASFKTYCRPLSLPRPYDVAAGQVVRQRIVLTLRADGPVVAPDTGAGTRTARLPQVMLAHEAGLSDVAALDAFPGVPVQLRLTGATPDADLRALAARSHKTGAGTALEIAFDDMAGLHALIARARAAGLAPLRVAALPRGYLQSHQPEGPWPAGPAPADALAPLRAGFPGAAAGGGSLTNFTELNRCRPDPAAVDFVTFGNTAIVHAADDLSVWQTLEALPDILATAADIAGGKPLHLGLVSIGMRSNPYGAGVEPNPDRLRLPMAMDDPRQDTGFAAAYAVAVLARAAVAGAGSLALAMPGGPLGARGPLADVVRAAAALAGQTVQVTEGAGAVAITAGDTVLAANCTPAPATIAGLAVPPESTAIRLPGRTPP